MAIKAFKGFNEDMTCRGFQYEEGKEYETGKAKICESGFHACEYPLYCLDHYAPNKSIYREVEIDGNIDREKNKICSTKIKIGAQLSIAGLVKAAIDFTMRRVNKEASADKGLGASSATGYAGASSATGDFGASSATGDAGASSATGYAGASSATGIRGASSATGDFGASSATGYAGASSATGYAGASSATGYAGASSATGDFGASSATGDAGASSATGYAGASSATGIRGASSATGDFGASSATGDFGASSATGIRGASSATGYAGASVVTGYNSSTIAGKETAIAVAWGYEAKAKGCIGAYLVLSDWEYIGEKDKYGEYKKTCKKENWKLNGAKLVVVDGKNIKADTYYRCANGDVVEAVDDDE